MPVTLHRHALMCLVIALGLVLGAGCKRKPEDLEKWRRAKGGQERIIGWAKSGKESMEVRKRAMQIVVEEGWVLEIHGLLDNIKDESARRAIASAAVPTVEQLWAKQDMTRMAQKTKTEGKKGTVTGVKIKSGAKAVIAKDAAYYLYPHVQPADQAKLQSIMVTWLAEDHFIRDQMGKVPLGKMLPRAGDKGMDGMLKWFETANPQVTKPTDVARMILKEKDPKVEERFAKLVAKKLEAAYPDKLTEQHEVLMLLSKHKALVPFAKKLVLEGKASRSFTDSAMDVIATAEKTKASIFFDKLIREKTGLIRAVAMERLLSVRGEGGVMAAVNALPLEAEKYAEYSAEPDADHLQSTSVYFCNILKGEYGLSKDVKKPKFKDKKPAPTIKKMLASPRWPAQVMGISCARLLQLKELKGDVEKLATSAQTVASHPEKTTIGSLATDAIKKL